MEKLIYVVLLLLATRAFSQGKSRGSGVSRCSRRAGCVIVLPRRHAMKNTHVFRDGMVIIIVAGLWLSWTIGATPAIGQTLFTQLSLPNGIATDAAGNVYIHNDSGLQNQITKFTPNGVRVGNLPIGGFFDTAFTGRLVFERNSGLLMDLLEPGLLPFINPNTLQVVGGFDLRGVTPD